MKSSVKYLQGIILPQLAVAEKTEIKNLNLTYIGPYITVIVEE